MRTAVTVLVAAIVAGCTGASPRDSATGASLGTGNGTSAATLAEASTATTVWTPAPSDVAPGIARFTLYTSSVYGLTFGYPDDWTLEGAATRQWQQGDGDGEPHATDRSTESFMNPESRDGDQIGLGVWQVPAGAGVDVATRQHLVAWFMAHLCDDNVDSCATVSGIAIPMCFGKAACLPAVVLPLSDSTQAIFADPAKGILTIVSLGRPEGFPAAARYGGAVQLLNSILPTMDVWTPEPGHIPLG